MESITTPRSQAEGEKLSEFELLIDLLKEGHIRINKYCQKAVLLIGATGEGKSTLCSIFGGFKLEVIFNEQQEQVNIDHKDPQHGGPQIGQWSVSCTRIPNQVIKELYETNQVPYELSIWDCPGFFDVSGVFQEIANSFYNLRLLENIGKMKIIFVVSERSITDTRGVGFKQALKNFMQMFEDIDILENSVALLVNKSTKKLVTIRNFIENIKQQIDDPKMIRLINFTKNSTYLFNEIKQEDVGKEISAGNLFEDIYQNLKYINVDELAKENKLFRMAIGESSLPTAFQLFEKSQAQSLQTFEQLSQQLLEFIHKDEIKKLFDDKVIDHRINNETNYSLFKQIQNPQIRDEVKQKDHHYMHLLIVKDILELKEQVQIILESIDLKQIQQSLEIIYQILRRNVYKDAELNNLLEREQFIIEKVEFVRFIQQVCQGQKQFDFENMKQYFLNVCLQLYIAEQREIQEIETIKEGLNYQYYCKVNEYLSSESQQDVALNNQKLAIVQYHMGVIKLNECYADDIFKEALLNNLADSIQHFKLAIELYQDPDCLDFPLIYRKIADIFLLDPQVLNVLENECESTNRKVFTIFDQLQRETILQSCKIIREFTEKNQVQIYLSDLEYLDDIKIVREFLINIKQQKGTSNNFDKVRNNYNGLLDFILEQKVKLAINQKNDVFNSDFNNNQELEFQDNRLLQELIQKLQKDFNDSFQGQFFFNELLQKQKSNRVNSWFQYFENIFDLCQQTQKEVTFKINIFEPENVDRPPEELLKIIELAILVPNEYKSLQIQGTAYYFLGLQCIRDEKSDEQAIDYFEQAISTDNAQNLARKQIADLYFRQQNYSDAIKVYRLIHKYMKAIQCYELLIKNDFENAVIKEELADFLLEIGFYEKAIQSYYETIEILSDQMNIEAIQKIYQKLSDLEDTRTQKENITKKRFENFAKNQDQIMPKHFDQVQQIQPPNPKPNLRKNFEEQKYLESIQLQKHSSVRDKENSFSFQSCEDETNQVLQHQVVENEIMNENQKISLEQFMNEDEQLKNKDMTLIYKGSTDGYEAKDFHGKCDKQGETITIVKSGERVFGGYTDINWDSGKRKILKKNGNTFIFAFNEQDFTVEKYKYVQNQTEIIVGQALMPQFGQSLKLVSKCNVVACSSELGINHELPQGFKDSSETKAFLAGEENFLVKDIEVYKLESKDKIHMIPKDNK